MKRWVNDVLQDAPSGASPELPPLVRRGVFETLLLRSGTPQFWLEHWARFEAGCRWHGFAPPASEAAFHAAGQQLVGANRIAEGVLRYAAWQQTNGGIHWQMDAGPPRAHMGKPEFRVSWGRALPPPTPDRAFKHLQRTAWFEALRTARLAGCDEVLLPDDRGWLVEGSVSNVFLVREGTLFTPDLSLGALPGVMRARVMAEAALAGWRVREEALSIADVERAEEIWLTNSLIGVRPVSSVGEISLPAYRPVLDALRQAWHKRHGSDPTAFLPTPGAE